MAWPRAVAEHGGGVLADDMGLGRIVRAIALWWCRPVRGTPVRHRSALGRARRCRGQRCWVLESALSSRAPSEWANAANSGGSTISNS
ncbi:hypothetical protein CDG81_13125 [Actinopolyspora erythraea]|uniref:Uncharacterized protein n=1 Tax=Actinopolyspora erythraea TaxID=414996 RepID=A0A223RT68_9ACTN|nr:hypothetical protein CDG81_13125 [Actinopolyspora erythraea]